MTPTTKEAESASEQPALTRDRLNTSVLLILTGLGAVVCALMAAPFMPAITWALALAIVAYPIHDWLSSRVSSRNLAAGIAVTVIAVGLLGPTLFVGQKVGGQATEAAQEIKDTGKPDDLKSKLTQNPTTSRLLEWVQSNIDMDKEIRALGESLQPILASWIRGTVWTIIQFFITIFLLFFMFRDRAGALAQLRSFLPLSDRESDYLLEEVQSMVHATIYGTLVVAAVQGALGGLMFWALGLPMPLLWGVAMGLLSLLPMLGAFVIWAPWAVWLAAQGDWGKTLILAAWGSGVVGLIDNLLFPFLVGKDARLHPVPIFVAILGGLFLFGASGVVLGPATLALTLAFLNILRRRTPGERSAVQPT